MAPGAVRYASVLPLERSHMKPRILIVEDDPRTAASVALYLRHAGYDVAEAADGLAALEAGRASVPDLVVLDLMLPGLDGMEVCRTLRRGRCRAGDHADGARAWKRTSCAASRAAPTTTSPSRSARASWWRAIGAVLRRAKPAAAVIRCGEVEIDLALAAGPAGR